MIKKKKEITFMEKEEAITLATSIPNKVFLVYQSRGPIIGYLVLTKASTEMYNSSEQMANVISYELCSYASEHFQRGAWVAEVTKYI